MFIHALPVTRKSVPKLISDPVALIRDIRTIVESHKNDSAEQSVTGKPLLVWPGLKNEKAWAKAKAKKKGYVILCLVDDWADSRDKVMHSSTKVLTSLFVRGRHLGVASWLLTQKNRVVSLICRTDYCWMMIWRRILCML